ncbi:FGLLP motif-containing membrane protein [Yinghuangia seranimata]|uniref:FGLLP motif-containing membrane protein n=1 Tax=Yinghuangia seranimata TaxID=408067 RepID=UPI00248C85C3|nr:FGLLP motif-containing membrane protein [Yinghuangia seranimata]MDI2129698.1 FGLLP motif-containing membrane protein [Yinghuangia seranimata]
MGVFGVRRRRFAYGALAAVFAAGLAAAAPNPASGADSSLDRGARLEVAPATVGRGDTMEIKGTGMRGCPTGRVDVVLVQGPARGGNASPTVTLVAAGLPMNDANGYAFTLRHTLARTGFGAAGQNSVEASCEGEFVSYRHTSASASFAEPDEAAGDPRHAPATPPSSLRAAGADVVVEPASGPPGTEAVLWTGKTCPQGQSQVELSFSRSVQWDQMPFTPTRVPVVGAPTDGPPTAVAFTVPVDGKRGPHTVKVPCEVDTSGVKSWLTATFTVSPPELTVTPEQPAAGSTARVQGRYFTGCAAAPPGTRAELAVNRAGRELARLPVAPDGSVTGEVTVPKDAQGDTTLTAACAQERFDGTAQAVVRVGAPGAGAAASHSGTVSRSEALAAGRSAASLDLPRPADVFDDPAPVVAATAATAVALPIIGFGAEVFNQTVERNRARIRRWLRPGGTAPRSRPRVPALQVAVFVVLSAVFTVVADPGAGLDRGSLALALALVVTVPLGVLAYSGSAELYRRRVSGIPALPSLIPGAVAVAVVVAAVSRLAELTPGYVFGLVLAFGAVKARSLTPAQEGRAVALGSVLLAALSGAAWLARVPLSDHLDGVAHPGFGLVLAEDVLTQAFVAGVVGLVFGLLPLRGTDGGDLWEWSRTAWALVYAVTAFLFVLVLVDPQGTTDGGSRTMLLRAGVAFGVFFVATAAFWAWFAFTPDPHATAPAAPWIPQPPQAPQAVQPPQVPPAPPLPTLPPQAGPAPQPQPRPDQTGQSGPAQ